MIDLWVTQAVHLSPGQAGLLIALALITIGLLWLTKGLKDV